MRRALAASFLVTMSAACTEPTKDGTGPAPETPASKKATPTATATATATAEPVTTTSKKKWPRIVVKKGECWEEFNQECAPGVKCNPPEPRVIDCPLDRTDKAADGTCSYNPPDDCPPDVTACNPPPPQKVKCPKGK